MYIFNFTCSALLPSGDASSTVSEEPWVTAPPMLPPPNPMGMKNGSAHIVSHAPSGLAHASSESYIPLDSCMSGGPLDVVPPAPSRQRRGSNTSIPDMVAPPPPDKSGKAPAEGAWDPNQTYDSPSKTYINDDNTYKVCTSN